MIRALVIRGLIAGLVAGVCAGALGLAMGETQIDRAIALEATLASPEAKHVHDGGAEVSRATQRLGLVLATGLYGLAIGGLVALAFAALRGRTAHRSDRCLAFGLTAALFVAVAVIPLVKYPASPPGVGEPETSGYRTELYLVMVAGSLAALLAAWRLARLVPAHRRGWRTATAVASFATLTAILALALPGIDEVPSAYPGGLLADFRLASAALQLTLWSVLGLSFAILVGRRPRRPSRPSHSP